MQGQITATEESTWVHITMGLKRSELAAEATPRESVIDPTSMGAFNFQKKGSSVTSFGQPKDGSDSTVGGTLRPREETALWEAAPSMSKMMRVTVTRPSNQG